jgi:hypothetical protein
MTDPDLTEREAALAASDPALRAARAPGRAIGEPEGREARSDSDGAGPMRVARAHLLTVIRNRGASSP